MPEPSPGLIRKNGFATSRLAVLKEIRSGDMLSRSDLPARTGLSAGSITQVTSELLARGLIVERKAAAKGRGRPRTYLEIADDDQMVLGADLTDFGALSVSFVDLRGRERFATKIELAPTHTLPALGEAIVRSLHRAIDESGISMGDLLHVGIGLPAIVDSLRGIVHFLMFHGGAPYDIAAHVRDALSLPVTIENDTACLARAEHWFGCAQEIDTFTLVNFSYAISSAQYSDGMPHTGEHGFTTELGHTKTSYGAEARPCYCGGTGCASAHASIYALAVQPQPQDVLRYPPLGELDVRFDALLVSAGAGDAAALRTVAEAGEHLGRMVANHINGADPGTIIILTPDPRLEGLIRPGLEAALDRDVLPGYRAATRIRFETALENWRVKGTAALALEQAYLRTDG